VVDIEAPAGWWIRPLRGQPVDGRPISRPKKTTSRMEITSNYRKTLAVFGEEG